MDKSIDKAVADLGRNIGEYIREQRNTAKISLRELAKQAGVSNPYLSQIERGLRKPSAEILQQIAKGLRISAEVLYVEAGILQQREGGALADAIVAADPAVRDKVFVPERFPWYLVDWEKRAQAPPSPRP